MPPKKKGEPDLPAVPEVEDDVVLPDEVEPVPEPSFCFVLGHLTGHTFVVEEPPPVAVEGEEPPEVPNPPAVRNFEPCDLILAKTKEAVDPLLKTIICIEREDLQLVATAEEKTLAEALKARLAKERAARHRRKHNDARKAAIASFEAAKLAGETGDEVAHGSEPEIESKFKADTLVLIRDFPSTQQELEEISALGLCSEGIIDLWTAVYVTGESLGELPPDAVADDDGEFPERPVLALDPPDMVRFFYDGIHAAGLNTELSNCNVCTLPRSHTLAFPPPETPLVDHVMTAILEAVGADAMSRRKFSQWLEAADRAKPVPTIQTEPVEKRLYERMIGSVDPLHHDIPLFLHCLTEQVDLTCSGKAMEQEEQVVFDNLNEYLGNSCLDILSGGIEPMRRPQSAKSTATANLTSPKSAKSTATGPFTGIAAEESVLLPHLDLALCSHSLAGGGSLGNGLPIIDVVHQVLQEVTPPGVRRSGLPHDAALSAAQREALKARIYPFAPSLPPCEFEQLLLLHAFEDLLNKAQPERKWRLNNRTYRERVPKELLAQTLDSALQCEPFVSSVYLPRHDCLLVALHYRSLAGKLMWHSWKGDLFSPPDSKRWSNSVMAMPTFNDWGKIVGGSITGCQLPQACRLLPEMDGREFGYAKIVEKLATPGDKSIILITRYEHGIKESFPFPTADVFKPIEDNTATILDGESAYDMESILNFQGAVRPTLAEQRFDAPSRHSTRLARVMKDGLAFGIVQDATWTARQREEQRRRQEFAKQGNVEAAENESPTSRPESPGMEASTSKMDTPLPFAAYGFGHFWVSFPDGARCNVRMHHEREMFPSTEDFPSGSAADEVLGPVGAMLTYSLAVGLVIQVFSDGAVRFTWPLAMEAREDGPAIAPVTALATAPRLPAGNRPHFLPGCPEDIEITRTITPFGTVIRKLLSGRIEVYHPDSTTAVRNPTSAELHDQVTELRAKHGPHGSSRLELLERFCKVYAATNAEANNNPSEKEKIAGLPGHWVVVKPDGSMFGRADGEPDSFPDAVLVDGAMQYPISTGVSVATQVDLQTKHKTRTNSHGMACYEDPDGVRMICDHADGTRVTNIRREGGNDVLISKEPMSYVKCEFNNSPSGVEFRVVVDCSDGTQIEIIPQSKELRPLGRTDADDFGSLSTHAWVHLKRPDIANIVSKGDGGVTLFSGADIQLATEYGARPAAVCTYAAQCAEGHLTLQDKDRQQFVLRCDQTLSVAIEGEDEPRSPRCTAPEHACSGLGTEDKPPPTEALPPRLFIVYGNGDAEELLSDTAALEILDVANADPQSNVVQGEVMDAPLEGCRCHTIFSTRVLEGCAKPPALPTESVQLSLGSLDAGWSRGSMPQASSTEAPPTLTKYRQLIEFPQIDEEDHQKFLGTLKQYREWEQKEILRNRAIMAGPEDKKSKAAEKKKAEKASKKEEKKRSRKSKRHSAQVEPAEIVELVLPKFVEDLNLPVFDHAVEVLRIRQQLKPEPTNTQLLAKAQEPTPEIDLGADEDGTDLNAVPTDMPEVSGTAPAVPNIEGISSLPPPTSVPEDMQVEPELGSGDMTMMRDSPEGQGEESSVRPLRPKVPDTPIFAYFNSDKGLQFLLDTGEMDPERRTLPIVKEKTSKQGFAPAKRTPWNPLLLGEVHPDDELQQGENEVEAANERDARVRTRTEVQAEEEAVAEMEGSMRQSGGRDLRDMPYTPNEPRLPIVAEDADTPLGPHPDKKGNLWDIYGNPRKQRPVASHAYVMLNTNYLEVEGATDRRVRTSSISHKKNSAKAPSVSSVRKTGQHALGTGTEIAAQDILGDLGLSNPEDHWKLTSSMQGLGDSNNLVEVTPGTCRFGPVRQGGVYRMAFYLRNLDVDVTRFNVGIVRSDFVKVIYQPGHIAPGMAAKVTVEVVAKQPGVVEQLVEVRMKAHVVRVPVTAKIYEAEEYDRLDAEAFVINRRHIGRHREKSDAGEKRAVEVVADEAYCRKVLGEGNYLSPPADFDETPMN